ncbi:MAG: restriction endonuclease subunit S [Anaerotignum sp.]|jgi:type I restriction enzyme S subunit|nr:restriction endonuclease subunit S [Anaerotignum sp.]
MNKKKEIVPKLRFPEFIGDKLKITKLGKISSVVKEKAGEYKYTLMSVTSGVGLIPQTEKFGREIAGDSYKNYIVIRKYDFAYNKSATKQFPEGYISMLGEYDIAAVPNSIFTCFRITGNESYPPFFDYLWHNNYHGHWLRKYIEVGARAHGALSVDTKHLWSMPLALPDFKEQQKIADCLSSIDELIDAESRKLKALEKYKKGLMQKLFPAEGKTLPEWRFPEFQGCGEWKLQKLKLICDFQEGYAFSSSDFVTNDADSNYIQVVRITDINNKNSNTDKVFVNMDLIKRNDLYKYLISKNDLILSLTGAAGFNFFIWNTNIAVLNQRTLKLIPKDEKNHAIKFLIEPLIHKEINMHGTGQNNNLSKEVLKNVEIVLPTSFKEQQKIADCLSEIDKIITEQSNKVEQLKAHKKGLMQGLFPSLEEADV